MVHHTALATGASNTATNNTISLCSQLAIIGNGWWQPGRPLSAGIAMATDQFSSLRDMELTITLDGTGERPTIPRIHGFRWEITIRM
jgi:hypothetical protein